MYFFVFIKSLMLFMKNLFKSDFKEAVKWGARYSFDSLNQLRKVEYPSYGEELFYDRVGNRTRRIADGVEEGYQYDAGNRLTALTRKGKRIPFRYDETGNLQQDDRAEGSTYQYELDKAGRLVTVTDMDGTRTYAYNHYDLLCRELWDTPPNITMMGSWIW